MRYRGKGAVMRQLWAVVIVLCGMGAAQIASALDIYFVRHAETVANATGIHNSTTSNLFSEQGNEQLGILTSQLKTLQFDAILVSPAPRALNTILPYLKESGQQGEIWPEMVECCWQRARGNLAEGRLIAGPPLQLEKEQAPYFTFRDDNSKRGYANYTYADGVAQVHRAQELLKERYFGSDKKVLIVAHYHSGQVLLAELLGVTRDELPGLHNAKLNQLHQGPDGAFTLVRINDQPAVR